MGACDEELVESLPDRAGGDNPRANQLQWTALCWAASGGM